MSAPHGSAAQALLLTGGLATGKTSVATAIGDALERARIPGVVLDLDWLCWAWSPHLADDGVHALLCRNLAAITPNLLAVGVQRFVLARGLLHATDFDALGEAMPGIALTSVRLTVSAQQARSRLRWRDEGSQLAEHLAELTAFEQQVRDAAGGAPVVDTTGRAAADVAAEVLRLVGWP